VNGFYRVDRLSGPIYLHIGWSSSCSKEIKSIDLQRQHQKQQQHMRHQENPQDYGVESVPEI
jgi:hypothetical protein